MGQEHQLPGDITIGMARFGRYAFDPASCGEDFDTIWSQVQSPLMGFAMNYPANFVAALAAAVLPAGGWAAVGAAHAIDDMVSPSRGYLGVEALLDAAVEFLRGQGIPSSRVPELEWQHWLARGGTTESWPR